VYTTIYIVSAPVQPCEDKIPNCNEYGDDLCTNPTFYDFRKANCRKFCGLCYVTRDVSSTVVNSHKCVRAVCVAEDVIIISFNL